MDEVRRAVIQKLEMMEKRAANHVEFWLSHQRLLHPDTSTSLLFEFLGISNTSLETPILSDQCEQWGKIVYFMKHIRTLTSVVSVVTVNIKRENIMKSLFPSPVFISQAFTFINSSMKCSVYVTNYPRISWPMFETI